LPSTNVLLATLTAGIVSADYCGSLADLLENPLPGVEVKHVLVHGSGGGLAHQRNMAAKYFMENGGDKLLFVDSDISGEFAKNLKLLLDSDKDIVGARTFGYSKASNETFPNWKPISEQPGETGLEPCKHIGMDFTLLSRGAIQTLGVRPADSWPYGYGTVDGLATATEDILFCRRAIEAGLTIFVNHDARVYHAKTVLV